MGLETVIQRICYKLLWLISEGLCDINFKATVYLHYFVLNLVFFFVCE